jgi:hypothetical protein
MSYSAPWTMRIMLEMVDLIANLGKEAKRRSEAASLW